MAEDKNKKFHRLQYNEFVQLMKRYERESGKKESVKKENKLAYKRVFKNGKRVKDAE